jgi:hypothetical protein
VILLRRLEDERNPLITHIQVESLTLEATTLLVSSILASSQEDCNALLAKSEAIKLIWSLIYWYPVEVSLSIYYWDLEDVLPCCSKTY